MFKIAGKSVAVKNAKEELKSFCDEIIGHHDDGSVSEYIQKIIKGIK